MEKGSAEKGGEEQKSGLRTESQVTNTYLPGREREGRQQRRQKEPRVRAEPSGKNGMSRKARGCFKKGRA